MIKVEIHTTMSISCDFPGCTEPIIVTPVPQGAQDIWRGMGWSIPTTANSPCWCPAHAAAERAAGRIP